VEKTGNVATAWTDIDVVEGYGQIAARLSGEGGKDQIFRRCCCRATAVAALHHLDMPLPRIKRSFFARSVHEVAPELVGATLLVDDVGGRIVEVEPIITPIPQRTASGARPLGTL